MQYTTLGNSGIEVSKLCLGGMSFGKASADFHQWTLDPEHTQAVIARAFEQGITFIDTANTYSFGTSEQYIGRALHNLGIARDQVVLASKVYFNEGHLSAAAIKREIEGTLTRLGTDYLDLYIMHRFDYDTPIEETMSALNDLVVEGKVRALGASEMYAYQFYDLQLTAQQHGWTTLSSLQCHYNLLYREDERELLPLARRWNVLPTPYSPLASGHLARASWDTDSTRSRTDATMRSKYDHERALDQPIIERVAEVADEHGVPMASIALAWHWTHGVSAPIVGCSSPERVDQAVEALDVQLSEQEVQYLEELYRAHELVGPMARPGEQALAGTWKRN